MRSPCATGRELTSSTKRLAIVEDDHDLRAALVRLFTSQPDFSVGPVASSGEELLTDLQRSNGQVDVGLVGLSPAGPGGKELLEHLREAFPTVAWVAYSTIDEPDPVFACLRAGAAGYLLKGGSDEDLLRSLRCLDQGGAPLAPRIAKLLLSEFHEQPRRPLSERELEVLLGLAGGLSYKEIAFQLTVSAHTVHTHVKNIYDKLRARGRRDAISKARRQGWLNGGLAPK